MASNPPDPFGYAERFRPGRTQPLPSETTEDPLAEAMREERKEEQRQRLKASPGPDTVARAQRVAKQAGLPTSSVLGNLDEAERDTQIAATLQWVEKMEVIGRALSRDPAALEMLSGDEDNISVLDRGLEFFKKTPGRLHAGFVDATAGIRVPFDYAANSIEALALPFDAAQQIVADQHNLPWAGRDPFEDYQSRVDRRFNERAALRREASRIRGENQSDSFVVESLLGGVEFVPVSVGFALSRNPSLAAAGPATTVGGNAYEKGRAQGLSGTSSLAYAASQGITEYLTEKMPAATLVKALVNKSPFGQTLMRSLGQEIPGEQVATAIQDLSDWAYLPENADKTFADYIAERPEAALSTLLGTVSGTTLNVTATRGVPRAAEVSLGIGQRMASATRARLEGKTLTRMGEAAAQSKLRERDPERFAELMRSMAEERGVSSILLDGKAAMEYMQSDDFNMETDPLAEYAEQVAEAAAAGNDVSIPVEAVFTQIAGTKAWEALKDDMRLTPGGETAREAKAFEEGVAEITEELDKQIEQRQEGEVDQETQREGLVTKLATKLETDAQMSPSLARRNAEIAVARIMRRGKQDPEAAVDALNVRSVMPPELRRAMEAEERDMVLRALRGDMKGSTSRARAAATELGDLLTSRGWSAEDLNDEQLTEFVARMAEQEKEYGREYRDAGDGRGGSGTPGRYAPLDGAPKNVGPIPHVIDAAEAYAEANGIEFTRQSEYITKETFDTERATRLAEAYAEMEHRPDDPDVAAAYAEMMAQTRAQYDALVEQGMEFYFLDPESEYAQSPFNALRDLRDNKRMGVFSTAEGFGSDETFDPNDSPLLTDTGLTWKNAAGEDVPVLANDLFRAVHDAFGHGLEGAGFRYEGEENAWQAHARLYTGAALGAMTSETRGQNSWLNFGPHGETNRSASVEETVFADQKTGLMPEWTWSEGKLEGQEPTAQDGMVGGEVEQDGQIGWTNARIQDLLRTYGYSGELEKTKAYAVRMSPDQFLGLTASKKGRALIEERVEGMDEYGGEIDFDQMRDNPQAPFLVISMEGGKIGVNTTIPERLRVMGHEGRHRMTMLKKAGVKSVPVVLILSDKNKPPSADSMEVGTQRSRSDQISTGDTETTFEGMEPISYANADRLREVFGTGRELFQRGPTIREVAEKWMEGREPLDPSGNADHYQIVLDGFLADYAEQVSEADDGSNWYGGDIAEALRVTEAVIPELADPVKREVFLAMAAILSPQRQPVQNWEEAVQAMQLYLRNGSIPTTKENGRAFGLPSTTTSLQLFQHLISTMGEQEAVAWLAEPHTGQEVAEVRRDSGLFGEKDNLLGYKARDFNYSDEKMGAFIFGPKVGAFMTNVMGLDQDQVTVDIWATRAYARHAGILVSDAVESTKSGVLEAPKSAAQRSTIQKLMRDAAREAGVTPSAMQAALWYSEQRIYREEGLRAESLNFSQGAQRAAERRGIAVEGSEARGDAAAGGSNPRVLNQSALPATIEVGGKQRSTTNSEGQQIAETERGVRNFWAWFGDSKVVDEQGRPLVMHHGTTEPNGIEEFIEDRMRPNDYDAPFNGFWFSDNEDTSPAMRNRASVVSTYLRIQNPAPHSVYNEVARDMRREWDTVEGARGLGDAVRLRLLEMGYDGVHWENQPKFDVEKLERGEADTVQTVRGGFYTMKINEIEVPKDGNWINDAPDNWTAIKSYDLYLGKGTDNHLTGYSSAEDFTNQSDNVFVAFTPTSVKSVNNVGSFSPDSPRIFEQATIFYSALERAAEGISTNRAPAQQWIATLKKAPGVKEEELEWTGLLDWLEMQKGPVEKEQVLETIRRGGIVVRETVLNAPLPPDFQSLVEAEADRRYESYVAEMVKTMTERGAEGSEEDILDAARDSINYGYVRDSAEIEMLAIHQRDTRFGNWTTEPGDETYRELLITLPTGEGNNPERAPSTHWDEAGVVAHTRFMDKEGPNGERILFVEEVQSDWHQKGRDQGYEADIDAGLVKSRQQAYEEAVAEKEKAIDDAVLEARGRFLRALPELLIAGEVESNSVTGGALLRSDKASRLIPILENWPRESAIVREVAFEEMGRINNSFARESKNAALQFDDGLYAAAREKTLRAQEAEQAWRNSTARDGIPNAPFKKTWPDLVMKRVIAWAASNGYDQIAWTWGQQQAERYNLSQAVGAIHASPSNVTASDGAQYYLVGLNDSRAVHVILENTQGVAPNGNEGELLMTEAAMKEAFGDDVARKITEGVAASRSVEEELTSVQEQLFDAKRRRINSANNAVDFDVEEEIERLRKRRSALKRGWAVSLHDADLNVGGEGMKQFYDRNLVNITNKLVKKYGAKVELVPVRDNSAISAYEVMTWKGVTDRLEIDRQWVAMEQSERDALLEEYRNNQKQPGLTITPELREAAGNGFPLFQPDHKDGPRARILFADNTPDKAIIELFENRNASSLQHELGHLYLEELKQDASEPDADPQLVRDYETVLEWFRSKGYEVRDGVIPVGAHELWARGWERYVMEGKAPSVGLMRAFEAFKNWLTAIYETVARLRAPITPEIREVFDRLLATDEEIEIAREAQALKALFDTAADAGMSEGEFASYQEQVANAKAQASAKMLERTMENIRLRETRLGRERRKEMREKVTAQIEREPFFRALEIAKDQRMDKAMLEELGGTEGLPVRVPPIYTEDGVDPELVAEQAGYGSAREMIEDMRAREAEQKAAKESGDDRPIKRRLIDTATDAAMEAEYGNPMTEEQIAEEAAAAVNSEQQGEVLASEIRALARTTGKTPTPYRVAREWARERVRRGNWATEASPGAIQRHRRAIAKAGREAEAALLSGDRAEALAAKQRQMLSSALMAEAKAAGEEVEAARNRMAKIASKRTMKSVDQDYLEQAHAMLEAVDLKERSQAFENRKGKWEAWAEQQIAEGKEVITPEGFEGLIGETNWSRLPIEQLLTLDEAVGQVMHFGRMKQRLLDNKEAREFEAVKREIKDNAKAVGKKEPKSDFDEGGFIDGIKHGILSFDAALMKVETLIDWLDNNNPDGPLNRYVFRPIARAAARERDMLNDFYDKMKANFESIDAKTLRSWGTKIEAPWVELKTGVPPKLTRKQVVAMALNWGNAGNRQRLVDGYGLREPQVEKFLMDTLTEQEWAFVQRVWDTMNELWPEIAAMERRVNGVEPEKVEATPFQTPFGMMRGGYYPAIYNSQIDRKARQHVEESEDLFSAKTTRATTRASSTKERSEEVKRPLLLDLGVINRHMGEVIHDITHREPIIQANRILSDPEILDEIDSVLGREYSDQFRPWLKYIANQWAHERTGNEGAGKFFTRLRANTTVVGMGFRFSTMMTQAAGYSNSVEYLGKDAWRLAPEIAKLSAQITGSAGKLALLQGKQVPGMIAFAWEKSGEMRHRMDTLDRDINQALRDMMMPKQRRVVKKALTAAQVFAFHGIGYMDMMVSVPTWTAAYNAAMERGASEEVAIYEGDKAVRLSQGSADAKDLAAIQRGTGKWGEVLKMLTMFYSYMSAFYQRQRRLGRDTRRTFNERDVMALPALMARAWFLLVLPPVLAELLAMRGPDEDEDWALWAFRKIVGQSLGPLPIARDVWEPAFARVTGQPSFGYTMSPIQGFGESIVNVAGDAGKLARGEDTTRATRNVLDLIGYSTGLVPGQIGQAAQFWVDVAEGEQDPDGVGEMFEGTTKGKIEE